MFMFFWIELSLHENEKNNVNMKTRIEMNKKQMTTINMFM